MTNKFKSGVKKLSNAKLMEAIAEKVDGNSDILFRLSIRAESLIKLLIKKNIITKEEFDEEIKISMDDYIENVTKFQEKQKEEAKIEVKEVPSSEEETINTAEVTE